MVDPSALISMYLMVGWSGAIARGCAVVRWSARAVPVPVEEPGAQAQRYRWGLRLRVQHRGTVAPDA